MSGYMFFNHKEFKEKLFNNLVNAYRNDKFTDISRYFEHDNFLYRSNYMSYLKKIFGKKLFEKLKREFIDIDDMDISPYMKLEKILDIIKREGVQSFDNYRYINNIHRYFKNTYLNNLDIDNYSDAKRRATLSYTNRYIYNELDKIFEKHNINRDDVDPFMKEFLNIFYRFTNNRLNKPLMYSLKYLSSKIEKTTGIKLDDNILNDIKLSFYDIYRENEDILIKENHVRHQNDNPISNQLKMDNNSIYKYLELIQSYDQSYFMFEGDGSSEYQNVFVSRAHIQSAVMILNNYDIHESELMREMMEDRNLINILYSMKYMKDEITKRGDRLFFLDSYMRNMFNIIDNIESRYGDTLFKEERDDIRISIKKYIIPDILKKLDRNSTPIYSSNDINVTFQLLNRMFSRGDTIDKTENIVNITEQTVDNSSIELEYKINDMVENSKLLNLLSQISINRSSLRDSIDEMIKLVEQHKKIERGGELLDALNLLSDKIGVIDDDMKNSQKSLMYLSNLMNNSISIDRVISGINYLYTKLDSDFGVDSKSSNIDDIMNKIERVYNYHKGSNDYIDRLIDAYKNGDIRDFFKEIEGESEIKFGNNMRNNINDFIKYLKDSSESLRDYNMLVDIDIVMNIGVDREIFTKLSDDEMREIDISVKEFFDRLYDRDSTIKDKINIIEGFKSIVNRYSMKFVDEVEYFYNKFIVQNRDIRLLRNIGLIDYIENNDILKEYIDSSTLSYNDYINKNILHLEHIIPFNIWRDFYKNVDKTVFIDSDLKELNRDTSSKGIIKLSILSDSIYKVDKLDNIREKIRNKMIENLKDSRDIYSDIEIPTSDISHFIELIDYRYLLDKKKEIVDILNSPQNYKKFHIIENITNHNISPLKYTTVFDIKDDISYHIKDGVMSLLYDSGLLSEVVNEKSNRKISCDIYNYMWTLKNVALDRLKDRELERMDISLKSVRVNIIPKSNINIYDKTKNIAYKDIGFNSVFKNISPFKHGTFVETLITPHKNSSIKDGSMDIYEKLGFVSYSNREILNLKYSNNLLDTISFSLHGYNVKPILDLIDVKDSNIKDTLNRYLKDFKDNITELGGNLKKDIKEIYYIVKKDEDKHTKNLPIKDDPFGISVNVSVYIKKCMDMLDNNIDMINDLLDKDIKKIDNFVDLDTQIKELLRELSADLRKIHFDIGKRFKEIDRDRIYNIQHNTYKYLTGSRLYMFEKTLLKDRDSLPKFLDSYIKTYKVNKNEVSDSDLQKYAEHLGFKDINSMLNSKITIVEYNKKDFNNIFKKDIDPFDVDIKKIESVDDIKDIYIDLINSGYKQFVCLNENDIINSMTSVIKEARDVVKSIDLSITTLKQKIDMDRFRKEIEQDIEDKKKYIDEKDSNRYIIDSIKSKIFVNKDSLVYNTLRDLKRDDHIPYYGKDVHRSIERGYHKTFNNKSFVTIDHNVTLNTNIEKKSVYDTLIGNYKQSVDGIIQDVDDIYRNNLVKSYMLHSMKQNLKKDIEDMKKYIDKLSQNIERNIE